MKGLSLPIRVSICLVCLTLSILFLAFGIGLVPSTYEATLKGRKALCEELSIHSSFYVQKGDLDAIPSTTEAVVRRNPDIVSAGIRRADGSLLFEINDHQTHWHDHKGKTSTHVQVPIALDDRLWGTVEVRFRDPQPPVAWLPLKSPIYALMLFVALVSFLIFYFYLRTIFRGVSLLQSGIIPRRVRTALNTLAEGVVILDKEQNIVMANEAFAEIVGHPSLELQGRKVSDFAWGQAECEQQILDYPWARVLLDGGVETGTVLRLQLEENRHQTLSVNSSPILSDDGMLRGAMATFDNLTLLEKKNANLRKVLQNLKQSRAEIRLQNQQLRILATRDPLTNCLNRRAFFQEFEKQWTAAQRSQQPLSCVMVDVDHFKSINDRHGHGVGDQVLKHVAETLASLVEQHGLICRYGGEEFCILLPNMDLESALQMADGYRVKLHTSPCSNIRVSASLGVSSLRLGARDIQELLNQADKALYAAKQDGRNRVVGWHAVAHRQDLEVKKTSRSPERSAQVSTIPIPFHAVTALMAALGYRHAETAEHSRRVADLCVATAHRLFSQRESYVLEVAAMLHDIGKLGVPDAILLKAGALDEEELAILSTYNLIGEQIIASAFSCEELSEIIRTYKCWYGGSSAFPDQPRGNDIPLTARILAIADAYDAMISDQVYRKRMMREAAFEELRRCAGTQFDPKLVERFIQTVLARDENRQLPSLSVSKQSALEIGLQIERLANALDMGDPLTLSMMAHHLNMTAAAHGVFQIADVASQLEQCALAGTDSIQMAELTIQLLQLCRTTYRSYLPQDDNHDVTGPMPLADVPLMTVNSQSSVRVG